MTKMKFYIYFFIPAVYYIKLDGKNVTLLTCIPTY